MENRIFVEIGIFDDFAPLTASHNLDDSPSGSVKNVFGDRKMLLGTSKNIAHTVDDDF